MKIPLNAVTAVVETLLRTDAHIARKYLADRLVVRATRVLYHGRIPKGCAPIDIRLTIGRPNYLERQFILVAKQAGESFPIRRAQLKFPARRKAA